MLLFFDIYINDNQYYIILMKCNTSAKTRTLIAKLEFKYSI